MSRINDNAAFLRALDANADPESGALLKVYLAGTTTPVTTYTSPDLSFASPWPRVADASGNWGDIYVPAGSYRVRIEDASGALIVEADNVPGGTGSTDAALASSYDWRNYVDDGQHAFIEAHDVASQDAATVTAGLQAMHDAMMAEMVAAGTTTKVVTGTYWGSFALNDEAFSETFAQNLWDLDANQGRFVFRGVGEAIWKATGWPSHKAVRTSGFYAQNSITAAVPMAMFRWERASKSGVGLTVNDIRFEGEEALTDPVGMKMRNINKFFSQNITVEKFDNYGRLIDDINNSREYNVTISRCGYQPTMAGGTGRISDTVRFSTVAGSGTSTITATESIWDAGDIGQYFMVAEAGDTANTFYGTITAVGSATSCTVDRQCSFDVVDKPGSFTVITGSITAGSSTLTLDVAITEDLVGRQVLIPKAGSAIHTELDLLNTRVIAHTGTSVTLASNAAYTVANVPIVFGAGEVVGKSDDQVLADGVTAESGHNNDYVVNATRNEFSFTHTRGSAPNMVLQNCLEHTRYACKSHGTSHQYNNNGANFCAMILDNCKKLWTPNTLVSWGGWHPDYGKIWVMGERYDINFQEISIGTFYEMEATAFFYLDPRSPQTNQHRFSFSGWNGATRGWPLTGQAVLRYGAAGGISGVDASGPFRTRATDGYPEMPPTRIGEHMHMYGDTPAIHLLDTNNNTRGRFSFNGGGLDYKADLDDDGVYETDRFSSLNDGFWVAGTRRINAAGGYTFPAYPATSIADATHAVNTSNKGQGLTVYDSTNKRFMVAQGSLATDDWANDGGGVTVTPS